MKSNLKEIFNPFERDIYFYLRLKPKITKYTFMIVDFPVFIA